jgi:hypothetical protein
MHPRSSRCAALGALFVAAAACGGGAGPRRVMDQQAVLQRQIEGLEGLVAAAEQGSLVPRDKLVVAVSEQVVRELAQLALPREEVIGGRYRVRLETVDVRFRDKWGSVRLDGRVSPAAGSPEDVFAELAVFGLLDAVEVDPDDGMLRGKVSLIGFELKRLGLYGESAAGRRLLEGLAGTRLDALSALAFPLALPVRLEQELTLPGSSEGPVRLRAARFPLRVGVVDVSAHGERLWVAFDVESGPWTRLDGGSTGGLP